MTAREIVLNILEAIGADKGFWASADTCQKALERAEQALRSGCANQLRFSSLEDAVKVQAVLDQPMVVLSPSVPTEPGSTARRFKPVWPDEKLEREMLSDAEIVEADAVGGSHAADVACHIKALLARVRELEAELRRLSPPLPPCGMPRHHPSCECNGMGGDR